MQAVILAGGLGKRLLPLTNTTNKHLLPIGGEPMVVRLVRQLIEVGVTNIIIGINGPFRHKFHDLFYSGAGSEFAHCITLVESDVVGGPGRTLLSLRDFVDKDKPFLCVLGDSVFFDGFPTQLINAPQRYKYVTCAMDLNEFDDPRKYGQIICSDDVVWEIRWKPEGFFRNKIQVPVYRFVPEVFDLIAEFDTVMDASREIHMTTIVHQLVVERKMRAVQIAQRSYIDAGTHIALQKANCFACAIEYA